MATNKRKDAAALFELIDKSTLKVPKNAGALKIPSWWSSKSNPSAPNGSAAATAPAAPATPRPATTPRPAPHIRTTEIAPTSAPVQPPAPPEPPSQHRLFDPHSGPEVAPSIRPPAASVPTPISPAIKAPPPLSLAPAPIPEPIPEPVAIDDTDLPQPELEVPKPSAAPAPTPRTNHGVPPTASGRKLWTPSSQGSFANLPKPILIAAAVGFFIVVACLFLLFRGKNADKPNPLPGTQTTKIPEKQPSGSLIPKQSDITPPNPDTGNPNGGNITPEPPAPTGPGRVYAPAEYTRSPDLLYVVIATSPSRDIAERNAKFIADHGVDVSIETRASNGKLLFTLVSVQGFPTQTAAESLRLKIVDIGHQTADYKKTRKAWDDAMVMRVVKPPAR